MPSSTLSDALEPHSAPGGPGGTYSIFTTVFVHSRPAARNRAK